MKIAEKKRIKKLESVLKKLEKMLEERGGATKGIRSCRKVIENYQEGKTEKELEELADNLDWD